jgi:hypothetical protein
VEGGIKLPVDAEFARHRSGGSVDDLKAEITATRFG